MRKLLGTPGTPRENTGNQRGFLRVTWCASWHTTVHHNLAHHWRAHPSGEWRGGRNAENAEGAETKSEDMRSLADGRASQVRGNRNAPLLTRRASRRLRMRRTHALASVATRSACQ